MINLPTQRDQSDAQKEKSQKIQLEATLVLLLFGFVNKLSRQVKNYYLQTGQVYALQLERQLLQNLLTAHYERVQKIFSKLELRRIAKQSGIVLTSSEKNNLTNILNQKASIRATQQSGFIVQTMQEQLTGTVNAQRDSIMGAIKSWLTETKKRIESSIVNTETQSVAEEAKRDTVLYVASQVPSARDIISVDVKWVDVGDNKVRLAHQEANGQVRPIGDSFLVGGEWLRYPGDSKGSPENIINCRCSLLTFIET